MGRLKKKLPIISKQTILTALQGIVFLLDVKVTSELTNKTLRKISVSKEHGFCLNGMKYKFVQESFVLRLNCFKGCDFIITQVH